MKRLQWVLAALLFQFWPANALVSSKYLPPLKMPEKKTRSSMKAARMVSPNQTPAASFSFRCHP